MSNLTAARRTVALGLLGPKLDAGFGPTRWEHWRPTVALFQHEDVLVDRMELLYQERFERLAHTVADDIRAVSPETQVRCHRIDFEHPWDFEPVYETLHDFATNYPFDPDTEDYLLHITTGTHVAQICLFLLTETRHFPGRLIQTAPPRKKRTGEPGHTTIIDLDLSKYDRIAARFCAETIEATTFLKGGIATRNRAFNALIDRIETVAVASSAPLLLTGPTGAGKTRLARRIYELKRRRRQLHGPLVEVNCATLRGDQAMSALFGHRRGAFTGAIGDRPGLLKAADSGLLFLDEVGELGLDEQAMLLGALESGRFLPVGADKEAESDFQLIAGTNRDLGPAVVQGKFREDLLSRINLWSFPLPGLRDRPEDIEPNIAFELEQFTAASGTRVTFNREARARFLGFARSPQAHWRGNFRDLNAAITRMATLADGGRIGVDLVDEEIDRLRISWRRPGTGDAERARLVDVLGEERADNLDPFDAVQLAYVLGVCADAKTLSAAGRALFAVSRTQRKTVNDADRLRKYLARFDLSWSDVGQ